MTFFHETHCCPSLAYANVHRPKSWKLQKNTGGVLTLINTSKLPDFRQPFSAFMYESEMFIFHHFGQKYRVLITSANKRHTKFRILRFPILEKDMERVRHRNGGTPHSFPLGIFIHRKSGFRNATEHPEPTGHYDRGTWRSRNYPLPKKISSPGSHSWHYLWVRSQTHKYNLYRRR